MAISTISGGNVFSKASGNKASILDTTVLLAISEVSSDGNFAVIDGWKSVIVVYEHVTGQRKFVTHKLRTGGWTGIFNVNSHTQIGDWLKKTIILANSNDDVIAIHRNTIGIEEDVTVNE